MDLTSEENGEEHHNLPNQTVSNIELLRSSHKVIPMVFLIVSISLMLVRGSIAKSSDIINVESETLTPSTIEHWRIQKNQKKCTE